MSLTITDSAAEKIMQLLKSEKKETGKATFLRLSVMGGGCSGFQYSFSFDVTRTDDDKLFRNAEAKVVIDVISLEYLKGSEIDYKKELIGSALVVKSNPNATVSCGCGSSFSIF